MSTTTAPPLSFYSCAPAHALELDDVERLGLLRLQVLCALSPRTDRALRHKIDTLDAFQELFAAPSNPNDACGACSAQNTVSHYALRLAFCKTRELIDWMVDAETALFSFHLRNRAPHAAVDVLAREAIVYASSQSTHSIDNQVKSDLNDALVYHVPFQDAWRLVQRRSVRMHRGLCLVPLESMHVVAQHHFRTALEQQLCILQRTLPANADATDALARLDATLERFVARVHVHGRSESQTHKPLQITAATIDAMAPTNFPLCMRQLHRKFREHHHLKYDGRLQYCMFLKGLGWSVHDTLVHFRTEFVRVLAPATFDKAYAYAIRHSYGLEGARKDYAPFDCAQIRHGAVPRHGQYHGCPFRHWDAMHLVRELEASGVASGTAAAIAQVAAAGDAQGACQRFFDASHARSYADVVSTSAMQQQRGNGNSGRSQDQHEEQQQRLVTRTTARVSHPNAWVDASLQSR